MSELPEYFTGLTHEEAMVARNVMEGKFLMSEHDLITTLLMKSLEERYNLRQNIELRDVKEANKKSTPKKK